MNTLQEKDVINTNEVITDFEFTYLISMQTSTFDFLLEEKFAVITLENKNGMQD